MSPASGTRAAPRRGWSPATSTPVLLVRTAHPGQAVVTATLLAGAALLSGRELREVGLVAATVLVGQALLGWDNDLVDRERDRRHELPGKPVAQGLLDPGTVWFTVTCAVLVVVPLSVANGRIAGGAYLLSLLVAVVGHRLGRRSVLSFVPWVVGFALWPAFLAYGGWAGSGTDTPPTIAMTVLAGLLGLGVHVLRSLPGLVPDHQDGWRSLPLRIALKTGAPRLLVISGVWTALVCVGIWIAGQSVGLR